MLYGRTSLVCALMFVAIGCQDNAPRSRRAQHAPDSALEAAGSQHSYAAWRMVQEGMTEGEVVALLGEPSFKAGPRPGAIYTWYFGTVVERSTAFPVPLEFKVMFEDGRVWRKIDPFDGVLSEDGTPTVPRLILPYDGASFHHPSALVDLRWSPSSGVYPMHYECQVDIRTSHGWQSQTYKRDIPYLAIRFRGFQQGRWRVRAANRLGESDWTAFWHFDFSSASEGFR